MRFWSLGGCNLWASSGFRRLFSNRWVIILFKEILLLLPTLSFTEWISSRGGIERVRVAGKPRMLIPRPATSNRVGFSTYAMWGLAFIVLGVCWKLESDEEKGRPAVVPRPPDVVKACPAAHTATHSTQRRVHSCGMYERRSCLEVKCSCRMAA